MDERQRGLALGVLAYLIWGLAPVFWIQTQPVDVRDLLAHRALWSLPFVALCLVLAGRNRLPAALRLFRQPRIMLVMVAATLCGGLNWLIFLWAVTSGRVLEASLGYFLLPLVNVAIGIVVFREVVGRAQQLAIGFALAGLLVQLVNYGGLPLAALGVAFSFGLYGAIRKSVQVESMEGLLLETALMAPLAIAWLVYRDGGGLGAHGLRVDFFLLAAGAYTAIPLMAYVASSRLLPLTALGLVFYIGPSVQLLLAVWVLGEPFDKVQLFAFSLVWLGLIIVTADSLRRARAQRRYGAGAICKPGR